MQILGGGKIIQVFLAHLFRCLCGTVRVEAILIQRADLPILDHQRAFHVFIIKETIREFVRKFTHGLEVS